MRLENFPMLGLTLMMLLCVTAWPANAEERYTYIVVLHDRAPASGTADPGEPDVAALGGEVIERWQNRRVVRMADAAARVVAGHRGVKYVQRVQSAGELPPPMRPEEREAIAANGRIESDWTPPEWSSGRYVYDAEGNITAIGTAASPASDGGRSAYVYDSAGRIVNVETIRGTTATEQYSYDSYGNLVNTQRTAGPSTATPASPETNRLVGVTYDVVGNVIAHEGGTTEYIYDGMNMIRAKSSSSGVAWYVYTADDERIGVNENGEQRWMVRDLSGRVLREWEGASTTWLWREDYIYRGSSLVAAERDPAEGGTRHFHLDHLGTPRLITDANRARIAVHDYFPFGVEQTDFRQEMAERGTDRPEPMKFTGHERDFTAGTLTDNRNQLDYMHARYYNPVWGRFLSVDPAGWDLRRPQSWNRYSYVLNNPVNLTDPTGRCVWDICVGEVTAAVVVLTTATAYVLAPSSVPGKSNGDVMVESAVKGVRATGRWLMNGNSGGGGDQMAAETYVQNSANHQANNSAKPALPKPPTGTGSVPPQDRDPKRKFSPQEREAKRDTQGGQCANGCGTTINQSNSNGHHVVRHADGGKTEDKNHAEVCKDCHKELHSPPM